MPLPHLFQGVAAQWDIGSGSPVTPTATGADSAAASAADCPNRGLLSRHTAGLLPLSELLHGRLPGIGNPATIPRMFNPPEVVVIDLVPTRTEPLSQGKRSGPLKAKRCFMRSCAKPSFENFRPVLSASLTPTRRRRRTHGGSCHFQTQPSRHHRRSEWRGLFCRRRRQEGSRGRQRRWRQPCPLSRTASVWFSSPREQPLFVETAASLLSVGRH